jgi:hypothetical protein
LLGGQRHLLKGAHVHEDQIIAVAIQVLDVGSFDDRLIHFVAGAPCFVDSVAGHQVLDA